MQSLYSIDNQPPFAFISPQEVSASTHQTLFYSSPQFLYGQHTLVIKNLGEQLFLDFFDVQDETAQTPPPTAPTASTSHPNTPSQTPTSPAEGNQTTTVTSTASAQAGASDAPTTSVEPSVTSQFTFVTETSLATATATVPSGSLPPTTGTTPPSTPTPAGESAATPVGATQSPAARHPRGLSKGAIAGIAVGSIILVAVLGAGLWWYKRTRELTWVADLYFGEYHMFDCSGRRRR